MQSITCSIRSSFAVLAFLVALVGGPASAFAVDGNVYQNAFDCANNGFIFSYYGYVTPTTGQKQLACSVPNTTDSFPLNEWSCITVHGYNSNSYGNAYARFCEVDDTTQTYSCGDYEEYNNSGNFSLTISVNGIFSDSEGFHYVHIVAEPDANQTATTTIRGLRYYYIGTC